MTKTDDERREFLSSLNLNPDAPALENFDRPAERPAIKQVAEGIQWAPEGVDPHTMPVTDIVFDPRMREQYPDLSPRARRAPSDFLFAIYKSYGRNKDRNSLLHRRIGEFLARTHKERTQPGGEFVKDKIRLANTLAEHCITEEQLAEFIAWKESQND